MRSYRSLLLSCSLCIVACGSSQPEPKEPEQHASTDDDDVKWDSSRSPPPEAKSKGAEVNEGKRRRSDEYDKEETDVVLGRAGRQVKENCGDARDEDGKAVGPWGKTVVHVQLGANGHSKGVTLSEPFDASVTGRCIEKAFTNLTFPPWSGADTQVDWEVEVVKPAAAPASPTKKK